jgi:hypothetical protein
MVPTTSSDFAKALEPGVQEFYGKTYHEFDVQYTNLFPTYKSNKQREEDVGLVSFGLAQVKAEGAPVQYDSERQGFVTTYIHDEYALGFIITEIMIEDNQYMGIAETKAQGLARSMRQTKEIVCANVYNRAFSGSYVGGDGVSLCNASHPNISGGTWDNVAASDLSELALEQACIDISKWTDDRGLKINLKPVSLIIPSDLEFDAYRILHSDGRIATADNDPNALARLGKFPGGIVVNNYLTDTDAWFIRTDLPSGGLKYIERRSMKFGMDEDFDTSNIKFKAAERYSVGWSDGKGIFGSPGA